MRKATSSDLVGACNQSAYQLHQEDDLLAGAQPCMCHFFDSKTKGGKHIGKKRGPGPQHVTNGAERRDWVKRPGRQA